MMTPYIDECKTELVNSHNFQKHASTIKTYSLIRREILWKGMYKDIGTLLKIAIHIDITIYKNDSIATSTGNLPEDLLAK